MTARVRGRGRRLAVAAALGMVITGALAWHYQSQVIGMALGLYLRRIASAEETSGATDRRLEVLTDVHRRLLMPPPAAANAPELFDLVTLLAERVAVGEVSLGWAAYLYTGYVRDLAERQPAGSPRRSAEEIRVVLDRQIEFFAIRKRPDVPGVRLGDIVGTGDDEITLEEIEAAEREGRELELH